VYNWQLEYIYISFIKKKKKNLLMGLTVTKVFDFFFFFFFFIDLDNLSCEFANSNCFKQMTLWEIICVRVLNLNHVESCAQYYIR